MVLYHRSAGLVVYLPCCYWFNYASSGSSTSSVLILRIELPTTAAIRDARMSPVVMKPATSQVSGSVAFRCKYFNIK